MKSTEMLGSIRDMRAVEDSIRATRQYTEGILTRFQAHPIQGQDFPSKVFTKYYEVYPDTKLSWDMPVGAAIDWLWRDIPCVNVLFRYDYRSNKATLIVKSGQVGLTHLARAIPGFREAVMALRNGQHMEASHD